MRPAFIGLLGRGEMVQWKARLTAVVVVVAALASAFGYVDADLGSFNW